MQGILLRGRAIKTNQAHLKNASATETAGGINASNIMLNPLLASLTANVLPNTGYMMGADPSALTGYATQGLQQAQMLQGGYFGMGGVSMMPQNAQVINPGFGFQGMANVGIQNPQGNSSCIVFSYRINSVSSLSTATNDRSISAATRFNDGWV